MSSESATSAGSPRISVMPAVCMATSVPPAIAMPTSAAASAGASLMPSPTIATTAGVAQPQLDDGGLVAGQHLGAHLGRCPVRGPRPRRCRGCRRSASPCGCPARAGGAPPPRRRLDRVAEGQQAQQARRLARHRLAPARTRCGPAASSRCASAAAAAFFHAQFAHPARAAQRSVWPSTTPATPRPGTGHRAPRARQPLVRTWSITARPAGARCRPAARRPGAAPRPASPSAAGTAPPARLALGERAGLVEGHHVTACATSSASASLIRMPWRAATPVPAMMAVGVARPSAQGQAMTSTATALISACSQSPVPAPSPAGEQRDAQHHRHEHRADAVDHALDRRLRRLGRLDHADDARQRRLGADGRRAHRQQAFGIDGAAGDRSPTAAWPPAGSRR
jgi:hypothetical protein